ncbi:NAD-dependent epimerase/dehydratase family protein [Methylophilus medardicus]|uniref:NAD-dependent epimerase/dehydratase family protein n=1 Tax=Methylophilus medardicus TaxID=2588534 RepID=A0A5B8CTC6_9PROT|nr:NAD-dependent epimerase/dehydratase family protein [Methylophilus medardicus]QDC44306.1 NAD-dependent epimerase/dehydratase family protein [Methylophilus medardicus]QDC49313.1 NAD-dependent epimerase/dehydratase family protein [Methylophilus medardicus]QDC53018.1 NAD-dependent epimerase/dehydratase family protein [Methylophilus medardicus]
MHLLITGASGFVGKALNNMLTKHGHITQAVNRNFAFEEFRTNEYECMIHLAGRAHVMRENTNQSLFHYRAVNVDYTLKIAELAKALQVKRFIFVSSVKVCGETSEYPLDELDTPNPSDAYGLSKLEAEIQLKNFCDKNKIELVIIRPPLIYGPNVKANFNTLLKVCKLPIPLPFASINNKRSFINLGNLNSFIELCCHHPKAPNNIFFVSDDYDVSISELISSIRLASGRRPYLVSFPIGLINFGFGLLGKKELSRRLLGNLQIDITKAKSLLGWKPVISFKEGIEQMVDKS